MSSASNKLNGNLFSILDANYTKMESLKRKISFGGCVLTPTATELSQQEQQQLGMTPAMPPMVVQHPPAKVSVQPRGEHIWGQHKK
jgi:hypothetical protein